MMRKIAMVLNAAILLLQPTMSSSSQTLRDVATVGASPVLAAPFATPSGLSKTQWRGFGENEAPSAPPGFVVQRFAGKLESPKNAIVLPNGDVLVAEARTERKNEDPAFRDAGVNRISLLRDRDGDGIAEARWVLLPHVAQPYGMALVGKRLYVADTEGIFWVPYTPGMTAVADSVPRTRIAHFTAGGYNNHWTRNLLASGDGRTLYVAIGSASNVGEFGVASEARRAAILRIDLKTSRETLFASGIRNPVGMAFEPAGGALWTSVNERDGLGDDLVPDYITSVRRHAFYGWPYSYWGMHVDPRPKPQRPDLVKTAIAPDYAVGAHVSALGIAFGASTRFPAPWRSGAFVARHGSWNRSTPSGYDVIFVPFADGRPSHMARPFLSGGYVEDGNIVRWRPRALAITPDGALLVVDDGGNAIWRIAIADR